MAKTYAEQLVETLEKQGVKRIFGLVGDSLNPIVDAVKRSSIEWFHVRNEEAAAFAAGAESVVTGELAVCAGSCGPGNTHLIQGLYDSHRNGAKVLAIASHIPSHFIGSHYFQETHPEALFQECSGYCEMVNSARQGATILHNAIQSTVAGNGVSVIVIPGDIAADDAVDTPAIDSAYATSSHRVRPDHDQVRALADAVNKAEKVTLFGGAGCAGAREQVFALAEKIKAPVGHAYGGKEYLHYDNPYDVGMSGLLGYGACNDAFDEADLLILVGTDFPYSEFLPRKTLTAQIDIKGANIGRRTAVSLPVVGDVAATIEDLLPLISEKTDRSFLDSMLRKQEKNLHHVIEAYTKNISSRTPIHPEYVSYVLDDLADDDAVFTADTGMCNVWQARYITPSANRRLLASFRHGTMANALPQAMGAQAADRNRQVISMSGDGGLGMLLGELLTVKLHQLPVKTIVYNNSTLGMVKLEMLVAGLPDFGTDHEKVNYADIAQVCGITSFRIEKPEDVEPMLRKALAHDGPVLVDVVTDPNALSIPPEISLEQVAGFTRAATRTVLEGGVGKMLGMARSNLRNIPRPSSFKGL
ncbi:pyruvate dehydrogenase [Corynebacterium bovis]|uniref:Ubiquinone-dependent pyruvate dehydrogenase n=3 Tax=Corynebacterium bovis TaxID=36808 RepID=A0A426Q2L7_9CORY|nr:pyruvate dehydrogenase [Corynebacterium bovis]RRO90711.1 ubiquinone-dependent pyruvate dehydrogenase [Corynebacterium bovis]RRO98150.1 ubiquinone-dependent pyruvate dehydrogenase [Corynebacterium bovis]RRO99186.1 ubiquinone-dependent pyruvate dehydrogenase [Corynebacterium bovis]RRO99902.1 ubiquinone-dependent pyruvate dehydrogenase [Corynebacterium bovis]RRQ02358.1 ubiquinone-dependent pyruvate dehydrogenase [Corynebacterium bovis]